MRVEADDVFRRERRGLQLRAQRFGGVDQSLQLQSNFIRFNTFTELIAGPVRDDGQMISNKHGT